MDKLKSDKYIVNIFCYNRAVDDSLSFTYHLDTRNTHIEANVNRLKDLILATICTYYSDQDITYMNNSEFEFLDYDLEKDELYIEEGKEFRATIEVPSFIEEVDIEVQTGHFVKDQDKRACYVNLKVHLLTLEIYCKYEKKGYKWN